MSFLKSRWLKAVTYPLVFVAGMATYGLMDKPDVAKHHMRPSGEPKTAEINMFILNLHDAPENVEVDLSAKLVEEPFKGTGPIYTYSAQGIPIISLRPK